MNDNRRKWHRDSRMHMKMPSKIAIYLSVMLMLAVTMQVAMASESFAGIFGNDIPVTVSGPDAPAETQGMESAAETESSTQEFATETEAGTQSTEAGTVPESETGSHEPSETESESGTHKEESESASRTETGSQNGSQEHGGKEPEVDDVYDETVMQEYIVTSFVPIDPLKYEVEAGTYEDEIGLPETVTANITKNVTTVYRIYQIPEEESPEGEMAASDFDIHNMTDEEKSRLSFTEESKTESESAVKTFHVEWDCEEYDRDAAGIYYFEAVLDEEETADYAFAEGVREELPEIEVRVLGTGPVVLRSELGVTVTADSEAILDPATQLQVSTQEEPEKELEKLTQQEKNLTPDTLVYQSFEIDLALEEKAVQPNGTVEVSIVLPEEINPDTAAVYHRAGDGTLTRMEGKVEDGSFVFTTNHFSEYILVGENIDAGSSPLDIDTTNKRIFADCNEITLVAGQTDGYTNLMYKGAVIQLSGVTGDTKQGYDLKEWSIYGGKNDVWDNTHSTNLIMTGGTVKAIYGGGYCSSVVSNGSTNLTISGGVVTDRIIGGGVAVEGIGTYYNQDINLKIENAVVNNVYCGGGDYTVTGNAKVEIRNSTVKGYISIGGLNVYSLKSATANITNSVIKGGISGTSVSTIDMSAYDRNMGEIYINVKDSEVDGTISGMSIKDTVHGKTRSKKLIVSAKDSQIACVGAENNFPYPFLADFGEFRISGGWLGATKREITEVGSYANLILSDSPFATINSTYGFNVVLDGSNGCRDGRIIFYTSGNPDPYTTLLATCTDDVTDPGIVNALTLKTWDGTKTYGVSFDPVKKFIRPAFATKVEVTASLDNGDYTDLTGLRAVNIKEPKISYLLECVDASKRSTYTATVASRGYGMEEEYEIYVGDVPTGYRFMVQWKASPTVKLDLSFVTQEVQLNGADGDKDYVLVNKQKYFAPKNDIICLLDTKTGRAEVNVQVFTGGKNLLLKYVDTSDPGKGVDEAKAGYKKEITKKETITATFELTKSDIKILTNNPDYGTVSVGYTKVPAAKTITVQNISNRSLAVALPKADRYEITNFRMGDMSGEGSDWAGEAYLMLAIGEKASFDVKPKSGLQLGNQEERIELFVKGVSDSVNSLKAFFEVKAPVSFNIEGQTHIKQGEGTTLSARVTGGGVGTLSYYWSTRDTTPSVMVYPTKDTEYILTITDSSGTKVTRSVTVTVEAIKPQITAEPEKAVFDDVYIMASPNPVDLKVTNTGNCTVRVPIQLFGTGAEKYTVAVKGELNTSEKNLAIGESMTVVLNPTAETLKTAGNYGCIATLKAEAVGPGIVGKLQLPIELVVYDPFTPRFEVKEAVVDCGPLTEGYTQEQADGKAKTFTMTYISSTPVTVRSPAAMSTDFEFMGFNGSQQTFNQGDKLDIKVNLKPGMKANGTEGKVYSQTFTHLIDASDADKFVEFDLKVSATVNPRLGAQIVSSKTDFKVVYGEYIDLTAKVTGGAPEYTYSWTGEDGIEIANTKSVYFQPEEGEHTYLLKVTDATGKDVTLSQKVTAVAQNWQLQVEPRTLNFGTVSEGYQLLPKPQTVKITNTGNVFRIVDKPVSGDYTITGFDVPQLLTPGQSTEFTVQPVTGRTKGDYDDYLYIGTGDGGASEKLTAKLEVKAPPMIGMEPVHSQIQAGDSAKLRAVVTGGTAPYQYLWDTDQKDTTENVVVNPPKTRSYTVKVTDACGSVAVGTVDVEVTNPDYRLTISESDLNFGSVLEGYKISPGVRTVVITNVGTKELIVKAPESKAYTVTGLGENGKELKVYDTVTVEIEPKVGLSAGGHQEKLIFTTAQGTTAELTAAFTVSGLKEDLSVEPSSLDFGSNTEGYTKLPASKSVTVTNKGNTEVTVKVPTVKAYTLTGFDSNKTLKVGESFSFSVQPAKGLAAGDHKEDIKLETQKGASSLTAGFQVGKKPSVNITGILQTEAGIATTLTASVSGGTKPYSYSWSTGGTTESVKVSPNVDTEYSVTVTDDAGVTVTGNAKVTVKDALSVTISGATAVSPGGSVTLSADVSGGMAPYTYLWNTNPVQTAKTIEAAPSANTIYEVLVADALGASASARVTVKLTDPGVPVVVPVYSLALDKTALNLGEAEEGYEPEPLTDTIRITNKSNANVTLKEPLGNNYTFSGIRDGALLKPGESVSLLVCPKAFMDAGTYDETITLRTAQGASVQLNVTFRITPAQKSDAEGMTNETIFVPRSYPYGDGTVQLDVEGSGQELVGISRTADYVNALLTTEEKQQVAQGAHVTLRLKAQADQTQIPAADKELTEDAVSHFRAEQPTLTLGMYIDIVLEKKMEDGDWERIDEAAQDVALSLKLPEGLKNRGDKFYLMRVHNGSCTQIAEWDAAEESWIFTSRLFSTYSISYTTAGTVPVIAAGDSEPEEWTFCIWGVLILTVFLIYTAGIWMFKNVRLKYRAAAGITVVAVMVIFAALGGCREDILMTAAGAAAVAVMGAVQYLLYDRRKVMTLTDKDGNNKW